LSRGDYSPPDAETTSNITEALELFFPDIDETAQTWAVNMLGRHILKLLEGEGSPDHLKRSVFQHVFVDSATFGKISTSFCSNFMKYFCGRILENKTKSIQDRIMGLFGDCGAGVIFEAMAFDAILVNLLDENEYSMRNLKPNAKMKTATLKLPGDHPKLRKVLIRKIQDIEHLVDSDIGVPVVSNFPLIDFVIKKPPTFLQMTTATEHSGAVNKLDDIRQALGNPIRDQKMVFVTTTENLNKFQWSENMRDIQQFVMCPGVVASPDVILKSRKKRKVSR
jgi:hypothetical protein